MKQVDQLQDLSYSTFFLSAYISIYKILCMDR